MTRPHPPLSPLPTTNLPPPCLRDARPAMRVLEIRRHPMGNEDFVDYPLLDTTREWGQVDVRLQGQPKPPPPKDGLQMKGDLLCREGQGGCVYSCGGLLARSRRDYGEEVWISVTPAGNGGGV